ncbi:MAG: PilZ domain-containing protein [Acidobacteriota bacterium]
MRRKPANERASERIPIGAPATLKWSEQELTGFVEVVNVAGMYVATPRLPQPQLGDYVELVFSLPGDRRSFRVRGNVVFLDQAPGPGPGQRRPGFGARFERPPVTLLDAIRNLNREH